ncbi:MAG: DUF2461 domain-containing protein [Nocardioides sp.]
MEFTGFPVAALDFYEDLEVDNSKSFWTAHKPTYDEAVRAPMEALCALLAPEFGPAKIFRPYRDVRFAKDKTPYKTSQGGFVATGPATGFYVSVSARGVYAGGGFYDADGPRLAAFRDAIVDDAAGRRLARIVGDLKRGGWEISGERLKTTPRGYAADHPRIELLRHKSLGAGKSYGFDEVIHTAGLADVVREDWRRLRPLINWLDRLEVEPSG